MRRAAEVAGIVTAALALAGATHAAGEAIELRGTGAQVYICEASPSGFGWRLKAFQKALLTGETTQVAWRSKPSFYAVSTEDRTINPHLERFMAKTPSLNSISARCGASA